MKMKQKSLYMEKEQKKKNIYNLKKLRLCFKLVEVKRLCSLEIFRNCTIEEDEFNLIL